MKIQDSTVSLSASHEASRSQTTEVSMKTEFRQLFDSMAASSNEGETAARERVQRLLQSLVDAILAAMDGKNGGKKLTPDEVLPAESSSATPRRPVMSWQQTTTETISESERTSVCGQGCVRTADGREIDFDFSLNLARDYSSTKSSDESFTAALRDPLVLSFDGQSCELTDQRICFDLNADGTAEQIPGLGAGSGFLVFDRNGNGKADDGSELFGVASGNGFADLAKLDSDHNGWIDEGDPAYKQLAVWNGDSFSSLAARGVGALYTGSVNAPFALKNEANELLGQIRSAGLYLTESGEVGNLQQVDLAVSAPAGREQPSDGQQLAA